MSDLPHNFNQAQTVDKFNPQLVFHNSNTAQGSVATHMKCGGIYSKSDITIFS